ncbi:MAG TPA: sodium:solute symporter [Tepidisphaeraceae bacterium]|nr:sodium:solute symporter [Tepidisphaeraceae bacterium]
MNALDYVVLIGSLLGIAAYGMWRTRGRRNLNTYLKGDGRARWIVIGLSVMATQASATTFLSTPGQGFNDGLGFVQNYFGAPFALILIAAVFLPIYRRLKVNTAYEYLGKRFDSKTRLLGAALFLLQRGLGAGITIYAPAIVLSTVFGWRLDLTILCTGLVVIVYTVTGGTDAVTVTQKYQLGVIFAGMITAFAVLVAKLPHDLHFGEALTIAGRFHKLNGVTFSTDLHQRYTFWSGTIGGMFLALSYFGTDQSQVQRYISGASLRESRLGLMFNAVFKIPMQFFILLLGVLLFVFYQFQAPPVYFNRTAWVDQENRGDAPAMRAMEAAFADAHARKREQIDAWLRARRDGDAAAAASAKRELLAMDRRADEVRARAKSLMTAANRTNANDNDYVFITFILDQLPHGVIGLLVAAFFAAAMSSKAAELNALGSTTTVDFYRHVIRRSASDAHFVFATKCFTVFWGLVAIGFALFAHLSENLIQAGNIIGSVFYGPVLGLFLVAFFLRWIGGTAIFVSTLVAQVLVLLFYYHLTISYLWYNIIGCAACMLLAIVLQAMLRRGTTNV